MRILLGEDDCKCGRMGKYFKIVGRIKNARIRGCSDTFKCFFFLAPLIDEQTSNQFQRNI